MYIIGDLKATSYFCCSVFFFFFSHQLLEMCCFRVPILVDLFVKGEVIRYGAKFVDRDLNLITGRIYAAI